MTRIRKRRRTERERANAPARQTCGFTGCTKPATERKEYCIDHLGNNSSYVANLQATLDIREKEEKKAQTKRGWRSVDVNGTRCLEIVEFLQVKGAISPKRLAVEIGLPPEAVENYLKALERAGRLRVLELGSRRGTPRKVVTLPETAMV